jgi:hypothetical protein
MSLFHGMYLIICTSDIYFSTGLNLLTCRRKHQLRKNSRLTNKLIAPYCLTKVSNFITIHNHEHITTYRGNYFFPMVQQHPAVPGLFIIEDSQLHLDKTHSVGLLWTSDQSDAETLPDNKQHSQETLMSPAEFEPAIPAGERPQTPSFDRAVSGNDRYGTAIRNVIFLRNYDRLRVYENRQHTYMYT